MLLNIVGLHLPTKAHPSRMAVLRVGFFLLLAFDLLTVSYKHAARYGADGLNVAHFDWLMPLNFSISGGTLGGSIVAGIWFFCALCSALAALGVHTSSNIRLAAFSYALVYFGSQIDSFQHHYLLCLLLFVFALPGDSFWHRHSVPAHPASESDTPTQPPMPLKHPMVPSFYLLVALVYFWTGIAKLDHIWLSGATLRSLTQEPEILSFIGLSAEFLYGENVAPMSAIDAIYRTLSWGIPIGELLLPLCFVFKKLRFFGLITAPFFHLGVEFLGLEIELFSFYMLLIVFVLLSPSCVWVSGSRVYGSIKKHIASLTRRVSVGHLQVYRSRLASLAFSYAPVLLLAFFLETHLIIALFMAATHFQFVKPKPTPLQGVKFLLTVSLVMLVFKTSTSEFDYYRMQGGDLLRRLPPAREVDFTERKQQALDTYTKANHYAPDGPARILKTARLLRELGNSEGAAKTLEAGLDTLETLLLELDKVGNRFSMDSLETQLDLTLETARFSQGLLQIDSTLRRRGDAELKLRLQELRDESQRMFSALSRHKRAEQWTRIEPIVQRWAKDGKYDEQQRRVILSGFVDSERMGCKTFLKNKAHRIRLMALQLGYSLRQRLPSIAYSETDSAGCASESAMSITPIVNSIASRGELARLSKKIRQVFK